MKKQIKYTNVKQAILVFAWCSAMLYPLYAQSFQPAANQSSSSEKNSLDYFKNQAIKNQNTNQDSALYYCKKYNELAKENSNTNEVAESNFLLGTLYMQKGKMKQAGSHFQNALFAYKQHSDSIGILGCYNGLSQVVSYEWSPLKSLDYNLKALSIAEKINDSLSLSSIYANIGCVYKRLDDYNKAQYYLDKSLKINIKKENRAALASNYGKMVSLNVKFKIWDEAKRNHDSLKVHIDAIRCIENKARAFFFLAEYYNAQSQIDSFRYYINQSDSLSEKYDLIHIQTDIKGKWGEHYYQIGKYQESIDNLKVALKLATIVNRKDNYSDMLEILGNSYAKTKQYRLAYASMRASKKAYNWQKRNLVATDLAEYEFQQVKRIEQENYEYSLKLAKQQTEKIKLEMRIRSQLFIGIMIIVLLTFGAIMYILYQTRIKNRKLKEKGQLIAIQQLELKKNYDQIAKNEALLKEANSTKDKLFSIVSHDLKSPFNSLVGFSEILSEQYDEFSDEERKKLIDILKNASSSAFILVDNLLNWAQSQKKNIAIKTQELNLHTLLNKAIIGLSSAAQLKKIKISNSIDPIIHILGDAQTLSVVFINLINNAIKFTDENGSISIETEIEGDYIHTRIIDSGVGMNKETIANLFDSQKVSSKKGTHNEKGTGLGLILCKEFTELNKGKIIVESPENVGTTFTVLLRLVKKKEG